MPKIAYAPGVWDMLHIGHINFLRRAKALADKLVVGVQADEFVEKQKGVRPIISTANRIATLEALDCVDLAVPYDDYNYLEQAKSVNADLFVLSTEHKEAKRFEELKKNIKVFYLPYDKSISTTDIKNSVIEHSNPWADIWEKVAMGEESDHEIVGHHNSDTTWKLTEYIKSKLGIVTGDVVLDYGCGAGLMLKNLSMYGMGIDVSGAMLKRAVRNCPTHIFLKSDRIPIEGHFDHIVSWGVLHYLPSFDFVNMIVDKMTKLSYSIILMEIPNAELRQERLAHRKKMGKIIDPEPLYFDKKWFIHKGFKVLDDYPMLTDNAKYSFSVKYDKV
jgi:glycerol-3-phosphate cytidylyltransferase